MAERCRTDKRDRLTGAAAAAGKRAAAATRNRGCARRSFTFAKNGPCEVHSGFHSPGVACEDRYLNHPYYDPLWAELERLGITAAVPDRDE
jgi:hypothetical protein